LEEVAAKNEKMKGFEKLLSEIRKTITSFDLVSNLLNAVEIYLMVFLVLLLFKLNTLFALIPSFAYLVIFVILEKNKNKYKAVENKYPELKEEIITAADNLDEVNPVVEELQKDIKNKLRHVELSSFIDEKHLSLRLLTIITLCFIIFIVAMLNVGVDIKGIVKNIEEFSYKLSGSKAEGNGSSEEYVSLSSSEDFYSEERIASLGKKALEMIIPPISYELNLDEVREPEERNFQESPFPEDVVVKEAEVYEDKTPQEHAELIKDYFLRITKG